MSVRPTVPWLVLFAEDATPRDLIIKQRKREEAISSSIRYAPYMNT